MTPIEAKHDELLQEGLDLGGPLGAEDATYDGGSKQAFQFGSIYFHPRIGNAFECHGAILKQYAAMGEEQSELGYPITDEKDNPAVPGGRTNKFENGSLFFGDTVFAPCDGGGVLATSAGPAVPLPQAVMDLWTAQQGGGAPLGAPAGFAFPSSADPGSTVFPFALGSIALNGAGTASVGAVVGADLQRYFQPKDDSQKLVTRLTGEDARAFVGADAALAAMRADIASATGGTDFIYLLNWHCNVDLELVPGDPTSTLRNMLTAAVAGGVQVRAMFWAGTEPPHPPLVTLLNPPSFVGYELIRQFVMSHVPNRAMNTTAAQFINGLAGDAAAILDSRHRVFGSHHMKVLVIRSGESLVAYIGGVEFNADRLQTIAAEPGSPLFDISARLPGAGAWLALDTFVNRWEAHPDKKGVLRGAGLPIPLPVGGPLAIQMTHTYGAGFPFPNAVRTASAALANGIRSARNFFYLEDQYCVGSPQMDRAIRDALSANTGAMGVIVIASEVCVSDLPDLPFRRRAFLGPLAAAFPSRFLVFERLGTGASPTGPTAYVHCKLLIVDDEAAFLGSVNSSRRSWFHDSEVDVTIVDTLNGPGGTLPGTRGWVRDLRCELWSRHFNRPSATLGDLAVDLAVWSGVAAGTVAGTSVSPYDATATVPRVTAAGKPILAPLLQKIWDGVEDPV
jgi:phosphatidylserine/phosphatidylglycerophosphate/cardiolipin synthase-like enzyme